MVCWEEQWSHCELCVINHSSWYCLGTDWAFHSSYNPAVLTVNLCVSFQRGRMLFIGVLVLQQLEEISKLKIWCQNIMISQFLARLEYKYHLKWCTMWWYCHSHYVTKRISANGDDMRVLESMCFTEWVCLSDTRSTVLSLIGLCKKFAIQFANGHIFCLVISESYDLL